MKRFISCLTLVLFILTMIPAAAAAQPSPPEISAEVAVLLDYASGEVIYAKNENEPWAPASLTKIITLYLAFDALKKGTVSLDDLVTVSEEAWRTPGSRMFIEVDKQVSFGDLLKGVTIVSGNDAAVALAEHLGGSLKGFITRMNDKAGELGMTDTNFTNPHGLFHENHYTTGLDMAKLARRYLQDFPEALEYHSTTEYTFNNITQQNRNGLLKYPEIDGLKTGYISGTYNLIATGTRDDYRLIAVIMGAASESSRERDAMALLNYGFNNFKPVEIGEAGKSFGEVPVYKGKKKRANAVLPEYLAVTIPKDTQPSIKTELQSYLVAPVTQGQEIGKLIVTAGDMEKSYPLVAEQEIRRGNFLKVLWHSFLMIFKRG